MRKIAQLATSIDSVRRIMIYAADGGAYLFAYETLDDGPCVSDEWCASVESAEETAYRLYGVKVADWTLIDDPLPGAQHDWIEPTRTKIDESGNKLWGQFEPMPETHA